LLSIIGLILLGLSNSYAGSRVALVVGNAAYPGDAVLANPVNDARAISRVFSDIGFDKVVTINDATRLDFETALDEFHALARDADIAAFFYAGHAIQWQGGNYMIPIDVSLESERDIKRLIQLDDVVNDVSVAGSLGLVILDACRDNPFLARLAEQGTRGFKRNGLASPPGASGTLVAFATQADAVAFDGVSKHSPYTEALIKHLPTPNKDISLVFRAIRDEVAEATDWNQQPFTYGSLGGEEIWLVSDESAVVLSDSDSNSPGVDPVPKPAPPPGMSFFSVDAYPADARVRILKPEMAYSPGMVLPLNRQYQIMVSRKGYRAQRQTVTISEPDTNVEVYLDSIDGKTPSQSQLAPQGNYSPVKISVTVSETGPKGTPVKNNELALDLISKLHSQGVDAVSSDTFAADMNLTVSLFYNVTFDKKYSAYNADCGARVEITHSSDNRILSSDEYGIQPAGGFSSSDVSADCQRRLMSFIPKKLMGSIGSAQRNTKGTELQLSVSIKNTDGRKITSLMKSVSGHPRVLNSMVEGFTNGTLAFKVAWQGGVFDFVDSMLLVAAEHNIELVLDEMNENNLVLAAN